MLSDCFQCCQLLHRNYGSCLKPYHRTLWVLCARGEALGLEEHQHLEELVERAEAAGHHHQAHAFVGHPELPHKEVVELEGALLRDIPRKPRSPSLRAPGLFKDPHLSH